MIGWMKFCSLTLLLMFGTNIVLHLRDNNRHKRLSEAQQREIMVLKARLYDKGQGQPSVSEGAKP